MRQLITALLTCLPLLATALPANVEHVETFGGLSQYRLKSNGMTILLHQDRSAPVATFMVVYHVGSRNEAPGNTGSAHLLEHMIFNKSTEHFGRAKGHKTFQEVLYEAGADAGSTNMTTWYDRMNGYSTVPSDRIDLAMKIEADRMNRALILDSERQSEMTVVRNEYEIGQNNPERVLYESVVATAITAHPYHWSTIGYRSDIEGVTTEKLREHYKTYFHPDNSEAILAGDFDIEQALALFDREFGGFAKAKRPIPQVITQEPPQEGERRTLVRRPGTFGLVMVGYTRPGVMHPDFNATMLLDEILSDGVNSRLYKALVDTGIATRVSVDNPELRDPFPFLIEATVASGHTHEEAEKAIKAVIAEVVAGGVTDAEVARAQSQIDVELVRARDGPYRYARTLGEQVASANWKRFVDLSGDLKRLAAADVQRVARNYFQPGRATVGWFVPLAPDAPKSQPVPPTPAPAQAPRSTTPPPTGAAAARKQTFAQRTVRRVFANGVIVDVLRNPAAPTVAIRGIVFAGDALAPPDQPALADLTAKMLPRGTTSRSKQEIGRILDAAGVSRSYGTTLGEASIAFNGLARDLPLMLGVLGEEVRQPAFDAQELARAKQELENDYLRADDNTTARAMERLLQLSYPDAHPYHARGRAAKVASARALTAEQLRAFHAQRYTGANTIIAIAGDVDPGATIALVERALGTLPKGERVTWGAAAPSAAAATREVVAMPGKANMNIVMGAPSGLKRGDADYEAALVGNAALGQNALASRIGRRVRDTEGLSYNLYSRFGLAEELDGVWFVNVNVAPENLAKALASTQDEIAKYAREGATEEEVRIQKDFFAGNYQVNLGSNAGVATALVGAERYGFGPSYLDEFPARIKAVTRDQANAAMRKHFDADKLHLIVSGDLEKLP